MIFKIISENPEKIKPNPRQLRKGLVITMKNYRTDLACEAYELHKSNVRDGVEQFEYQSGEIKIVRVDITNDWAALKIGKPRGSYVTIEVEPFSQGVSESRAEIEVIANEVSSMLEGIDGLILVAGLGNRSITPDALGPRVAEKTIATRHIGTETLRSAGLENFRPVAVLAPGVLGQTGIETGEIIHSVTKEIRPAAVLVIDALASGSSERLGSTVQVSDTGISPGSGVLNSRKEISERSLGVKVVSVGVPTVVDANTLFEEYIMARKTTQDVRAFLEPHGEKLMITPREIDVIVERAAEVLSCGINRALHPGVPLEQIQFLLS